MIDPLTKIKDDNENIPPDKKVFNLLTDIVNTIDPEIQCKNETPSDHPELNFAVPFLDTAIWIEPASVEYPNGKILHKHYVKPTNSKIALQNGSAYSKNGTRTVHLSLIHI